MKCHLVTCWLCFNPAANVIRQNPASLRVFPHELAANLPCGDIEVEHERQGAMPDVLILAAFHFAW